MVKYNAKSQQIQFDRRLFVIMMITKWQYIVAMALVIGILSGVWYQVSEGERLKAMEYESTTSFYVEYALKENGEIYYAYNEAGWSYVVMFDEIVELALEQLPNMSKDDIYRIVSSENGTDYKILIVTATAEDPNVCQPILDAFIPAMEAYGESSRHIEYIQCAMEPTTPQLLVVADETVQVVIAGTILGGIVAIFLIAFWFLVRDVYYVESTLQATFEVAVLEVIGKNGTQFSKRTQSEIPEILEVVAGKTTYGTIARAIEEGERNGTPLKGVRLVAVNEWVHHMYYR